MHLINPYYLAAMSYMLKKFHLLIIKSTTTVSLELGPIFFYYLFGQVGYLSLLTVEMGYHVLNHAHEACSSHS